MLKAFWFAALALTVSLVPTSARAASGAPIVRAPDGAVRGVADGGLRLFQGLPYAAPPSRWRAPQPVTPWKGIRNATRPGNECVQSAVFWRPGSPASWDENCLYLNVRAPAHGKRLPVLVWFHGGGHVNGAGTDVQPARLARWGNNVVVTINYRLGALGYLSLPGLDAESADASSSGNYGELDKIEALRWVKRNIAAFGGDPKRVTIAGQSAGATSVCWLTASPTAAGLFARSVIQSATICGISHAIAVARGTSFAKAAGCTDPNTMVACLRGKTPAQIIDAQAASNVAWRPAVGGTNQPLAAADAFAAGRFNRVPVIVGNTRHENRAFDYEANDLVRQPVTAQGYEAAIRSSFGANAERVLAAYPVTRYPNPDEALAAVHTDQRVCPMLPLVSSLSAWVPTYAYEFRDETAPGRPYMVIPSPLMVNPAAFGIGTGHTSDVPYVWQSETAVPLTAKQLRLSKVMIGYWSRFARAGSPNGSDLPRWPRYVQTRGPWTALLAGGHARQYTQSSYDNEHHCAFMQSVS
jgi:para-nitrobenzyl esterase